MTACAAYRASDEKSVLPSHVVCQVQDSCESQGARAVKSGTRSLLREPSPPLPCLSLSCQVFVLWEMFFVQMICGSSVYPSVFTLSHVVLCLTAFSARQLSVQTGLRIIAADPVIFRKTHWEFRSVLYIARHTNLLVSSHNESTSAPRRRRSAARLPGNSRHTHPHVSAATVHVRSSS